MQPYNQPRARQIIPVPGMSTQQQRPSHQQGQHLPPVYAMPAPQIRYPVAGMNTPINNLPRIPSQPYVRFNPPVYSMAWEADLPMHCATAMPSQQHNHFAAPMYRPAVPPQSQVAIGGYLPGGPSAVSYTHLTLPTKRIV